MREGKGNRDRLNIVVKSKNSLYAPFDVVMFNTCSSGTIEFANVMAPYANYMMATPSYKSSLSYDYQGILKTMLNNPETSAESICKTFMDCTNDKFFNKQGMLFLRNYRYMVYNLQELDNLLVELNKVFKQVYDLAAQGTDKLKCLIK